MNYKMVVYAIETDGEIEHIAEFPALKGVSGVGKNQVDAINDLYLNAQINIEALKEAGLPIPIDDIIETHEYSGKLSVRLSKVLHRRLSEMSMREGISINQCIVEAISSYVVGKNFEYRFNESTNLNKVIDYMNFSIVTGEYQKSKSMFTIKNKNFESQFFNKKKEDLYYAQ